MSPLVVGIVLIVIAVILLVLGFLGTGESSVEERLSRYTESGPMETEAPKESKPKSNPLTDYLDKTFSQSDWFENISKDLARADLKLRPTEYISLMVLACLGTGLLSAVLFQSWVFVVVGGIIGLFIPGFYIRQKQKARLRQFENQIADMLNLTVNSLRAGYSILQALESVSKEMPVPTSAEIRRVVQEVQIGLTLDTALDNLLRRMNSADLKLVITAMNIQREVGGNLAEILDTISHTIRERVRIKGEISVMTAQQTYTGYLIALLPFILGGAIFVFNRSYVMRFVDEESRACGIPMLACGLIMIIAGFLAVRKIVQIDI
jgi:tight adherence protein B